METTVAAILAGVLAFVSTNVDDLFLLVMFFSDRSFAVRQVVLGQVIGFAVLTLVSLACAALSLVVPPEWIGLLGLLPLALGLQRLVALCRKGRGDQAATVPDRRGLWAITAVTIAHGADNFGVYIPLFAAQGAVQNAVVVAVFAVMTVAWILAAKLLVTHPLARQRLQRLAPPCIPWVLIALGLWILRDALPLLGLAGE